MYSSNGGFNAIHYPDPISGVTAIGRQADNSTHYTIIMQSNRYILWGYYSSPDYMTNKGKKVFVNTVKFSPLRIIPIFKVTLVPFVASPTP